MNLLIFKNWENNTKIHILKLTEKNWEINNFGICKLKPELPKFYSESDRVPEVILFLKVLAISAPN